jgi:hypothetical protein
MPEEEVKDIHQIIDIATKAGIKAAMIPIYWFVGVPMLTFLIILVSLTGPMQDRLSKVIESDAKKVDSSEAYANFVTKLHYNQLEKDNNRFIVELVLHPESIKGIMQEADRNRAENLEIRYRSAE